MADITKADALALLARQDLAEIIKLHFGFGLCGVDHIEIAVIPGT